MKTSKRWKVITIICMVTVMMLSLPACGNVSETNSNNKENSLEKDSDIAETEVKEIEDKEDDKTEKQARNALYKVGDEITMGMYEQDNDTSNGAEPIEWIVLDTKEEQVLLLSKYVLCSELYEYYHKEPQGWVKSTIYQWLNNDFFNSAFTDEEKRKIIFTKQDGNNIGSVFFLSFDEAVKYFNMTYITEKTMSGSSYKSYYSQEALAVPTPYAIEDYIDEVEMTQERYDRLVNKGIIYDESVIGNVYVSWWLRTNADNSAYSAHVIFQDGNLNDNQSPANRVTCNDIGVRPAMWVSTNVNINENEEKQNSNVNTKSNNIEQLKKHDNIEQKENNNPNQENTENEYTDLSRFYGYNLPLRFNAYHTDREDGTLAFSVTDKGDYCILEGSLTCPECVETSVIEESEVGDQFTTGSGHTYTITRRESYNNDQREKVSFQGDDGKNYEITNIPAFFADAYKGTAYYIISSPEENSAYETKFENVKLRMDKEQFPFIANLEEEYEPLFYDIGFADDGTIDVLQAVDYGSNGPWDSIENIEIWQGELE